MKHKFFIAAIAVCGLLKMGVADAQNVTFCDELTLGLKVGSIQKELGYAIEQRCGKSGGLYTSVGLDYSTKEALSVRAHYLGINLGAGYDFAEMLGVEDVHPFIGINPLFGINLVNASNVDPSYGLGFKVPVGADYYISEQISAGAEYAYNYTWGLGNNSGNGDFHSFFARVNFLF